MSLTIAQAFDKLYANAAVDGATDSVVAQRRGAVSSVLRKAFPSTSNMQFVSEHLIGSMGRRTASKPFDDIDIMVHIQVEANLWSAKYQRSSSDFLYRVRTSLNNASTVHKVGARGQAVRLFYTDGLSVDVAPVVRYTTGGYAIPDGNSDWLSTDPLVHAAYMTQRNTDLSNNLRRFVVIAKQWNKTHSSYLSSFHLEMLAARTFASLGTNSRVALRAFFDFNAYNLSVQDPAGYSGDLSRYLTTTARTAVNASLIAARDRADLALAAEVRGDHAEAIRLWRIILGSRFPTS